MLKNRGEGTEGKTVVLVALLEIGVVSVCVVQPFQQPVFALRPVM